MPHLNELQAELGDRGLSIVAFTSEGTGPTEKWIAEKKVEYAYAYDPGGKFKRALGLSGLPGAVLVDPAGRVVWQGHPATLTPELLEAHLDGAFGVPLFEWPAEAQDVVKEIRRGKLAAAVAKADPLRQGPLAWIPESLARWIGAREKAMDAAVQEQDWLGAQQLAEGLAAEAVGLPAGDRAARLVAEIAGNAERKKVVRGQNAVRERLAEKFASRGALEDAVRDLEKIARQLPGTAAAREAEAALGELRERLESLR